MLTLNVPGSDPVLQHSVETRPKAIAQWLDGLPLTSPEGTAQKLVMALYALNRHPLGDDDRHALLTLYRPAIERAAASLEAQLVESGVPPNAQLRRIGTLLRELRIEHSIGYKQVLLGLTGRLSFGRTHARRTAEATARLLAALRDIQTACYLAYTPLPAGLWQEMHQVYAYAQALGLDGQVTDGTPPPGQVYRQALLIALADPPHLSRPELVHTRLYLDKFAKLAQLGPAPAEERPGFAVATAGDVPPNHLATGAAERTLWLDTDALCRHLRETAVRLHQGDTPSRIGLPEGMKADPGGSLCTRLLKQWSGGAQRAFRRFDTPGSTLRMVAGVSAIHRLLEQQTGPSGPAAPEGTITDAALPAAPAAIAATEWTVRNDSAAGLALSGKPDAPLNLKVGDPLALQADETAAWSLGVIRWIQMRDAMQVELGVERLSPQIRPARVRLLRGQHKASPEPALFVPGTSTLGQNDRLLLPRSLYQIGMEAEVWHPSHHCMLTFGRRLEHTPSFDLIDFTLFADEQP